MSDKFLRFQNDVPTRWNSTLHMINRMIKVQVLVNEFLSFYKFASGRKEFKYNQKLLSDFLCQSMWVVITSLRKISL